MSAFGLSLEEPCADEFAHAEWLRAQRPARRPAGSPLHAITGGRLAHREWEARAAGCRSILGVKRSASIGPRYRTGTNHPLFQPWSLADFVEPIPPCLSCGMDGGEAFVVVVGNGGRFCCPGCQTEWIAGDYDWNDPADCRRYLSDAAAGLIYRPDDERCATCGELQVDRFQARGCEHGAACPFHAALASLFGAEPEADPAITPASTIGETQ